MQTLTIIIPSYNEAECIRPLYESVEPFLKDKNIESRYLFVDDGSKDDTLKILKELREEDKRVHYISFSKNFGKEAAMQAGLINSKDSDMVIIMDSDLQHPPYLIEEMLQKHSEGYKIVYSLQRSRKKEGLFRKTTARAFYSFFNKHAEVPMEQSMKDYMLLDKVVVEAFLSMPDEYRFLRGIFSYVGFKRCSVEFDYVERELGKTKWNFKKLFKYGVANLNQFSTVFMILPPIASIFSFLVALMSIFFVCFEIINMSAFIVLISISVLFCITNAVLHSLLYVLYSTRKEAIKRPLYFIEESSLDE